MRSRATTPAAYLKELPDRWRPLVRALRAVLRCHLPRGFREQMAYGMITWVVPLSRYPAGYHCTPGQPLPFISLAAQRHHVGLYHLGLYDPTLRRWLEARWSAHSDTRLDLAVCCLRLRDPQDVPLRLIGQLARRTTVERWVRIYESSLRR